MNLVKKKLQNSNSRIMGLLGRASLEGLLIKWLPEGQEEEGASSQGL